MAMEKSTRPLGKLVTVTLVAGLVAARVRSEEEGPLGRVGWAVASVVQVAKAAVAAATEAAAGRALVREAVEAAVSTAAGWGSARVAREERWVVDALGAEGLPEARVGRVPRAAKPAKAESKAAVATEGECHSV